MQSKLQTVGWREWVALPELGILAIKAKVDTGARTTALHAYDFEEVVDNGTRCLRFKTHPLQRGGDVVVCQAEVVDKRVVSDSGGHRERRWVILSELRMGELSWPVEITLTSRKDMRFRMLIGRTALNHRALVDPSRSYVVGKRPRKRRTP